LNQLVIEDFAGLISGKDDGEQIALFIFIVQHERIEVG
jgi:hypothetical protein